MSHTYTSIRAHVVFSTAGRRPVITPEIQPRLWDYIGGIGRNHKVPIHAVGGATDHVHVLLSIPPAMDLAKIVQDVKAYSSKWINEEQLLPEPFAWQRGYGGFSVSASNADGVEIYIRAQAEHHAKHSFEDEYRALLIRHGVQFDERYIFG